MGAGLEDGVSNFVRIGGKITRRTSNGKAVIFAINYVAIPGFEEFSHIREVHEKKMNSKRKFHILKTDESLRFSCHSIHCNCVAYPMVFGVHRIIVNRNLYWGIKITTWICKHEWRHIIPTGWLRLFHFETKQVAICHALVASNLCILLSNKYKQINIVSVQAKSEFRFGIPNPNQID